MNYKIFNPGLIDLELLKSFIVEMDDYFQPTLASRVNIHEYSKKLRDNATCFCYFDNVKLIAISICYINKAPKESFGTYLAVKPEYESFGLGLDLTLKAIRYAYNFGSSSFRLKIRASNTMLLKFYKKQGFEITAEEMYPHSDIKEYELIKYF